MKKFTTTTNTFDLKTLPPPACKYGFTMSQAAEFIPQGKWSEFVQFIRGVGIRYCDGHYLDPHTDELVGCGEGDYPEEVTRTLDVVTFLSGVEL